jgi:hypothetical protein
VLWLSDSKIYTTIEKFIEFSILKAAGECAVKKATKARRCNRRLGSCPDQMGGREARAVFGSLRDNSGSM